MSGPGQTETTLRRGISVLFTLGSEESAAAGGLGVVRVAELLGLDKSLVSRTLRTLEDSGAVERDPDTLAYRLSWRMATLSSRSGDLRLREVARPIVTTLTEKLAESAYLSVLTGSEVRTVLFHGSQRVVQAVDVEGQLAPLHCTSAGRALLLDHAPNAVRRLLTRHDFTTYTPATPASVEDLIVILDRERDRDFVVVADEYEIGLTAIAAPVRHRGRVVAALNVSGPGGRLGPVVGEIGRALVHASERLSVALQDASES